MLLQVKFLEDVLWLLGVLESVIFSVVVSIFWMQDSFEDDKSKILMILCASPDPKEMHKTLCTLEYGAKAKCIVRGSHTPNKDKNGGDESSSAVILGTRIAAMDEFISKLQTEKKQQEKERNEAQKQLKKKEDEVAALRSLLKQKEACPTNEEEIKEKVNERTQLLKSELEKKLEECRRMAEEFVEMERRRMEERIVQQQEELEMMRRRLEEIEVEFRRSRDGGSTDETSGFAKRLRSLYSDDDMVKSMDLDMGDPEPVKQVWGAVSHQSSNTISSNFTNILQPKPSENMLAQMYPDRVCLSTVFEEEELEEDEEKVIVEDKSICSIATPMPSLNFEGLGKENSFNSADDKESASSRKLRIQNIFTLCGNQRELSQHIGQEEGQANNASADKKDDQLWCITNKAEALAAEEAKENNMSADESRNGQIDIYVKWEAATDNPRKQLITTLRVTKDATLADLRKLIEIYLGSDNQAFTFLKLGVINSVTQQPQKAFHFIYLLYSDPKCSFHLNV